MKIILTGASGMLGTAVKETIKNHELIPTDIHELDVRKVEDIKTYERKMPDLIIHLAAETDLEKCENNPAHAYMTNHTGTLNMTLMARRLDIPIVYISTAGVFNGEKDSYTEYDTPDPMNHYGMSKWYGEMAVRSYHKHWIFRAGWMMGGGELIDKKFVNLVYAQIKAGKRLIYGLSDIYGSPTYTKDLAMTIENVISAKAEYGVYHSGGMGRASRYDVAKTIVEALDVDVTVTPVKNGFFQKDFFCPRSKSEVLENTKLNAMNLSLMRSWKETVIEYVKKDFKKA